MQGGGWAIAPELALERGPGSAIEGTVRNYLSEAISNWIGEQDRGVSDGV